MANEVSTKPDATMLREAIALARKHSQKGTGGPFGAVIALDGVVIGRGWNKVVATNDPTAHAEVVAIRAACRALGKFHLHGCVLYTSCEPCPMCLAATYWAHVDRIVYAATRRDAASIGFDDAFLYREFGRDPKKRRVPMQQLLRAESRSMMRRWREMPGRVLY
jgi:tRNA(Arg) A34 adenosine deaminase TadA